MILIREALLNFVFFENGSTLISQNTSRPTKRHKNCRTNIAGSSDTSAEDLERSAFNSSLESIKQGKKGDVNGSFSA